MFRERKCAGFGGKAKREKDVQYPSEHVSLGLSNNFLFLNRRDLQNQMSSRIPLHLKLSCVYKNCSFLLCKSVTEPKHETLVRLKKGTVLICDIKEKCYFYDLQFC